MKKIGIACDHAAYELKEFLVGYLASKGFEVKDFGCHSEESVDYPDFAHPLAEAIESGELERGIGLCGSGEGISMTLNKHQAIRAALCWIPEIAKLSRQHNSRTSSACPHALSLTTRLWRCSTSGWRPSLRVVATSAVWTRCLSRSKSKEQK